jgi:hypothetical protein
MVQFHKQTWSHDMNTQPRWDQREKLACMRLWTDYFHTQAKQLFEQDRTHGNMLFFFDEERGLISADLIPPKLGANQVNASIKNAVQEHNLYGVILIGESWAYFIKDKDHTACQLLNGEMGVSDLRPEDRKETLIVQMENCDGDCIVYLNEIVRDTTGVCLGDSTKTSRERRSWF